MRPYLPILLLVYFSLTGCNSTDATKKASPRLPSPQVSEASSIDPLEKARGDRYRRALPNAQSVAKRPAKASIQPLPIEGLWVPSGFMGDAETPGGGLDHRIVNEASFQCDHWIYTPGKGSRQFVAVAYQFLRDGDSFNFGDRPGMDLSGKGYTQIAFFAKGKVGGERIVFHSGGHTRPAAPYPASYQATLGMVVLKSRWERFVVSLENCDLRNTTAALVFVITPRQCPSGCEFYLRDIAFLCPGTDADRR